jgi:dynein heavy chain
MPLALTMQEAHASVFMKDKNGLMESLATFLGQEMSRFNRLIKVMDRSLSDIKKAIKGVIVMSPELDAMYTAILNNQIPPNWMKCGYPSLKPLGSWFQDMLLRVKFIREWLTEGKPIAYWLASFFFP